MMGCVLDALRLCLTPFGIHQYGVSVDGTQLEAWWIYEGRKSAYQDTDPHHLTQRIVGWLPMFEKGG